MKILIIDLLSPDGHRFYNKKIIKILRSHKIEFLGKKNYLNEFKSISSQFIPEEYFVYKNKLDFRIKNIKKLLWINQNYNFNEYDIVLFTGYETISVSIIYKLIRYKKIYIINHNNLMDLYNPIKRIFFKSINKNISHIVLDESFEKILKDKYLIKNNIYTLRHPVESIYNEETEKIIFAPSQGNDEKFFNELIVKKENLQKQDYKLYVKTKNIKYSDENLVIYNDFISDEKYLRLFKKSKIIFLFYDENFNMRVSSILLNALASKKIVITNKNEYFISMSEKYPNLIYTIDVVDEFIDLIVNNRFEYDFENLKKFECDFSDRNILQEFDEIVKNNEENLND